MSIHMIKLGKDKERKGENKMTINPNKAYGMKQWFGNKLANELKRNLHNDEIFAIMKETEKAVYCMISIDSNRSKSLWIPKSALEEYDEGDDGCCIRRSPMICENYEECLNAFHEMWHCFM